MPDVTIEFAAGRELDDLPADVASVVGSLPDANAKLLALSAERLWAAPHHLPDTLLLRNIAFQWSFYLVKQGKKTRFFFKRREWFNVVLSLQLSFKVVPHPPVLEQSALRLPDLSYRWMIPAFVIPFPSPEEFLRWAPANTKPQDTILLAIGPGEDDIFALADLKQSPDKVKMQFTPRIGASFTLRPADNRWPAAPFLALLASIRNWIVGEFESQQEVDLSLAFDQQEGEVEHLLRLVTETYTTSVNRLTVPPPIFQDEVYRLLALEYRIKDYDADLQLRLDDEGELAADDDDDPFKLQLQVKIRQEKNKEVVRIRLGPPDFLVSGTLYQGLLDKIKAKLDTDKDFLKELGKTYGPQSAEGLKSLLEAGAPGGSVFRIQRKKDEDTNVFAVPFAFEGQSNYLIFSAKFKIPNADEPEKIELKDRPELLYDPKTKTLDKEAVKYFVKLIRYIKQWFDHLQ